MAESSLPALQDYKVVVRKYIIVETDSITGQIIGQKSHYYQEIYQAKISPSGVTKFEAVPDYTIHSLAANPNSNHVTPVGYDTDKLVMSIYRGQARFTDSDVEVSSYVFSREKIAKQSVSYDTYNYDDAPDRVTTTTDNALLVDLAAAQDLLNGAGLQYFNTVFELFGWEEAQNSNTGFRAANDAMGLTAGQLGIDYKSDDMTGGERQLLTPNKDLNSSDAKYLEPVDTREYYQRCFLAGTSIDMPNGKKKPIEKIGVGDEVLSYDNRKTSSRAALKPARVSQTFTNTVSTILDFHGLMVTPGHVTLCGDGPYKGQHRPLMDIIRDDGAVVDRDGQLIRAATNCPVGSEGDQFVEVAYTTDADGADLKRSRMRAGTLLLTDAGDTTSVLDCLEREGYVLQPDGLVAKEGEAPHPLYWFGELPRPEDYVLKKSGLTLDELYSDPEALAEPSRLDAVTAAAWRDRTGARVSAEAASQSPAPRKKAGNTLH